MKICIDEDLLNEYSTGNGTKLSLPELLIGLVVKLGYNPIEITNTMVNNNILFKDIKESYLLYQSYATLIQQVLLNSDKSVPKVDSVEKLAVALQELYPKGMKKDDYGKGKWSWRGNKKDITLRLQKFFKLYGTEYSYDDIIKATKKYVDRYKDDDKYMMVLQYFILKQDKGSVLANELEALDSIEETINTYKDGEIFTIQQF